MTYSTSPAPPAVAAARRRRPALRRLLLLVATAACVPYLSLKVAWIAGSHVGIPDGSPLLEHRLAMALGNGLTVLMDAAVVVLALLLTRPWGLRVPAWLLAVPMWGATGLLAPIMIGYPLQLAVHGSQGGGSGGSDPFLAGWVFAVVYGGFIVQGLALGALFTGYARDRWGHLWQGRVVDLSAPSTAAAQRLTAVAAVLLALVPAAFRLAWACGTGAGLPAGGSPSGRPMEAVYVALLAAACLGAVQLAFRRGRTLPVTVPLTLAWLGSGAVACWGGWMTLATLVFQGDDADRPTPQMSLTYAVQMIVGFLVASVAAHYFADRSAKARR